MNPVKDLSLVISYLFSIYFCLLRKAGNKTSKQAEYSVYHIKMFIKVSHCCSGKIMVPGHNAGNTERQGEGETC